MKSHNDYTFEILYGGGLFRCEVNGMNVTIQSRGLFDDRMYESLRHYLDAEGFIKELDERKGILNLFKS